MTKLLLLATLLVGCLGIPPPDSITVTGGVSDGNIDSDTRPASLSTDSKFASLGLGWKFGGARKLQNLELAELDHHQYPLPPVVVLTVPVGDVPEGVPDGEPDGDGGDDSGDEAQDVSDLLTILGLGGGAAGVTAIIVWREALLAFLVALWKRIKTSPPPEA